MPRPAFGLVGAFVPVDDGQSVLPHAYPADRDAQQLLPTPGIKHDDQTKKTEEKQGARQKKNQREEKRENEGTSRAGRTRKNKTRGDITYTR